MTFPELQRLVGSITFCGGLKAWGAELRCRRSEGTQHIEPMVGVEFLLTRLPDRNTDRLDGGAGAISCNLEWKDLASMNREMALEWVRRVVIRKMVVHEADESILYRGVRVFDPHLPADDIPIAIRRADEAADKREAEDSAFRWSVRSADPRFGVGSPALFTTAGLAGVEITSIIVDELP